MCTDSAFDFSGWPSNIAEIAAGAHFVLGRDYGGKVYISSLSEYGDLDVSGWSNITQIDAGYYFAVALTSTGSVLSTGIGMEFSEDGKTASATPGSGNPNPGCMTTEWSEILQVCADWSCVGMKADGRVVASPLFDTWFSNVSEFENVKRVYHAGSTIIALKNK